MPLNSARITLIAPGCFSSLAHADAPESRSAPADSVPELNDSSVMKSSSRSYEQALAVVLNQPIPELGALPVAQYRFLFDTDKKAPPHCVCAELIHLQADKDNARLLPMQSLNVTDDEANQLIEALNNLIRDDGLELIRTKNNHYYLTGMPANELDTWPAHAVANGKIADYLPRKSEAGDWRRLMTEAQMLFHAHPVNVVRANANQLPINGIWFWGGMQAPAPALTDSVVLVATDAFTCGMAKTVNVIAQHPDDFDWTQWQSDVIVVDLSVYEAWLRGDHAALQKAKQVLHEQWVMPAQKAVANGVCGEFMLDGCEGQAILEKAKQAAPGRFWQRFSVRKWFDRSKMPIPATQKRKSKSDSNS